MTNKIKKSNEGHEAKVPMGRSIGLVFLLAMLAGGAVTFFAVAGRTQGVIEQRRELRKQKEQGAVQTPDAAKDEVVNPLGVTEPSSAEPTP